MFVKILFLNSEGYTKQSTLTLHYFKSINLEVYFYFANAKYGAF